MVKKIIGIVIAGVMLSACSQTSPAVSTPTPAASASPATAQNKSYTTTDVSNHATPTDCWTIINSNVYDITSYIPQHPGGNSIVSICGKDGTEAFNSVGHSQRASDILTGFQIGTLKQ